MKLIYWEKILYWVQYVKNKTKQTFGLKTITTMTAPRSLGFLSFLLVVFIGYCFSSILEKGALFGSPIHKLNITDLLKGDPQLLKTVTDLQNAYKKAKEMYGDEFPFPGHQDPEENMNASELITSKGYPCERHKVITTDGFILTLQRIPHGLKDQDTNKTRPVALLQHGLLGSATNFLTNLANQSLAYVLADAGYDVWLGNSRGSTYSRRHVKYPKTSKDFWAWSFDEMAKYDLPASVNYITNHTQQKSIYYLGHSQGTLIGFMGFSENKELAKKIRVMIAMGPVFSVGHMTSPLTLLTHLTDDELFFFFGKKGFLPENPVIKFLGRTVCKFPETRFICMDIIQLIAGHSHHHLNATRLPVYLTHTPSGTSTRNMDHFAQNYRTKITSKYDFGSEVENIIHYGQPFPPRYNVSEMDVPVALYSGSKDILADPTDVKNLSKMLKNVVDNKCMEGWAHLEFMWGIDAPQLLYNHFIKLMKKF